MQLGEITTRYEQNMLVQRIREAVLELRAAGKPVRILVQAPCGAGKTVCSSMVMHGAMEKQKTSAFMVRGRLLVTNKSKTLTRCGIPHAILMDGHDYYPNPVTVVSVDTYASRAVEKGTIPLIIPNVWIIDEAHLAQSDRWISMIKDGDVVIGFTATPAGKDGRGMGGFWQKLIIGPTYKELLDKKLLVPCVVFGETMPDLSQLSIHDGDWSQEKVGEIMSATELVGDVVRDWKRWGENRPTLGFASSVDQSIGLMNEFNAKGIPAAHVDADTETEDRERIFGELSAGKIKVIWNVGVLTTGVDFPFASCLLLAFATKSVIKFMQVVGRGLRTFDGKQDCIVIDFGGNVHRHGWPTEDREWSLDTESTVQDRDLQRKDREQKPREPLCCPKCGAMRESGPKCHHCGHQHLRTGIKVKFKDGHIGPLKRKPPKKQSTDYQTGWMRILAVCAYKGWPCKSASVMFKKSFGDWPENMGVGPIPDASKRNAKVGLVFPGFLRRKAKA